MPAAKDIKTFIRVSLARELEFSRIFTKQTHHKGSKDEFDHMTNWSRIFEDLYEKIKWLNDFSKINHIAIFKIIQKFERTFFKFSPSPIALQLKMRVQNMPFRQCQELDMLLRDFVVFYAKVFCGNNVKRAKRRLEKKHEQRVYDMKI